MRTTRMTTATRLTAPALALALALAGAATACDAQEPPGLGDERLRVMIDSLLPVIADVSGLEVRQPVRFAMQSRADARAFIERQLEEELGPEELDGMERSYKRLGLLPDTIDLRSLLLELYTEQVVGYYDPKTDRLYVVEGADPATAGPVVAHELVHALQDQHADLDSLVARERGNDRQMAAQAAAEGQATLVMIALQAAQTTGQTIDPGALPDLRPLLRPALEAENTQFPVFQQAPRLIKETLIFPYLGGASFIQALYRARTGDDPPIPFGDDLPQSTEQVLDPDRRFFGDRDVPTEITLGDAGAGWATAYSNVLGQLETSILLTQHLGDAAAGDARGWDGDRYALLRGPAGEEALVWYSVWDNAAAAGRFAGSLRQAFVAGEIAGVVERAELGGRPGVVAYLGRDGGDGVPSSAPPVTAVEEVERR